MSKLLRYVRVGAESGIPCSALDIREESDELVYLCPPNSPPGFFLNRHILSDVVSALTSFENNK